MCKKVIDPPLSIVHVEAFIGVIWMVMSWYNMEVEVKEDGCVVCCWHTSTYNYYDLLLYANSGYYER